MTFLNPFLLVGLVAAAIPILIHLLNLRKLKTVEFSSLRFLKELQKNQIRHLKIRQLLLLILRTLFVIALVLAFTRPALRGTVAGTIGTHAKSTVVILLDDSPSMLVRNERGPLFNQARDAVRSLLSVANEGDEIYLIRLSDIRHTDKSVPVHSTESIESLLSDATTSQERVRFSEAVAVIAKTLSESRNINKEVFIVTDAQSSQFRFDPRESSDLIDEDVKLFLVSIAGPAHPENLGISALSSAAQIISMNKPMALDVVVGNTGTTAVQNALLSLYLDGARVVQQSMDIQPKGSVSLQCTVTPKREGVLTGYVQLEDDLLESDNRHYFVIDVPQNIRIALVGTEEETRFPRLALSAVEEVGAAGSFAIQHIDESQLSSINLASFDVIILCGVEDLTDTEAERVAQFVRAAGGLAVFPGDRSNAENFNTVLLRHLTVLPAVFPTSTAQGIDSNEPSTGFTSFSKVDLAHPIFSGLFEEQMGKQSGSLRIESPQVFKAIHSVEGKNGTTLIELSDGTPFLTEYGLGSGRFFLFAVDAGLSWSDFAVKGIYAPLLHRCVLYLVTGKENGDDILIGDPVTMNLRIQKAAATGYLIKTPSDLVERVIPRINAVTGLATFTSSAAHEAGIHELYEAGDVGTTVGASQSTRGAVAVNIDPAESDLQPVTSVQLSEFCSAMGIDPQQVESILAGTEIAETVREARFGFELWKQMLGAAILLALCEMVVAWKFREDHGVDNQR